MDIDPRTDNGFYCLSFSCFVCDKQTNIITVILMITVLISGQSNWESSSSSFDERRRAPSGRTYDQTNWLGCYHLNPPQPKSWVNLGTTARVCTLYIAVVVVTKTTAYSEIQYRALTLHSQLCYGNLRLDFCNLQHFI